MNNLNLTDKEKADFLDKLELELRRNHVDKSKANIVLRLRGFYGDYLEVGVVYNPDYEIYKKIMTEDLIKGVESNLYYVVNPGFINRYYKQKWYRKVRNLD